MRKGFGLGKAILRWCWVSTIVVIATLVGSLAESIGTLHAQEAVLVPAPAEKDGAKPDEKPNNTQPRALPLPFDDLEDWLGDAPPGVDPKQWEALRQMLRRQREEMQRMIEQLQQGPWFRDRDIWPFGPLSQRPGRLGVVVEPLHPALRHHLDISEKQGLLIREVVPDSPAARAGIQVHDILVQIGDKEVPDDPNAFVRWVGQLPAGKVGKVVVIRKGKKETLGEVELPETLPRRPRLVPRRPLLGALPRGAVWLQVQRTDGQFTVQYREGDELIRIEGQEADGQRTISKIEITEGRETKTYKSLDEVPAAWRDKVSQILDSALKGEFVVPAPQPKRFD
ncbi:MAG: PDZ domain-containing protein [Gemmatales bacterium]|nr:PDZ domain-containing protein [Gemmatales bacterium]MDW7995613.1 PDZ domain-containing protein [Gemmatales bacterium]